MFRKHFKRLAVDNIKKTGLHGYDYDFSVDYGAIAMMTYWTSTNIWWKKWQCNKMFQLVKKVFFAGLAFFSTLTSVNSLSCFSMNQECKIGHFTLSF